MYFGMNKHDCTEEVPVPIFQEFAPDFSVPGKSFVSASE